MKLKKNIFVFLLLCLATNIFAQDKLVLKSGQKINCRIISLNPSTIEYKDSTSTETIFVIEKSEVLMAEYKSGGIYIFGSETPANNNKPAKTKAEKDLERKAAIREKEKNFKNNIYGFQPVDIIWGRLTFTFERLLMEKRIGIAIPFSLTYDPRILMQSSSGDTIVNTREKIRYNTGVITGLDLNYYYETKSHTKFFFGPRFRYGTDVNLANITAYTVQFQNGFLLCDSKGRMASTLAFGFGFARIISAPFSSPYNAKQSYPWASFTLRVGIRR